jgi:radical SAM superfamily enzyme YgiQ (UPF0313 family)
MAHIVLINPRFDISYWGMEHALPLFGFKAMLPVACLPLLAALTPPEHAVTLIDENVEAIDFELCARADIVGVTGMSVQRFRMKEILIELKRRQIFVVVGGPWVTVQEDYFDPLADVVFIGEAEETWPRFLAEWVEGKRCRRYEQADKTDMSTVPVPRFDLLRMRDYAFGSVQFSRGCPFTCEFCDIIVVFGRKPRIKGGAQILAELGALAANGVDSVFIVDDNIIGNKKAIKEVLRELVAWQIKHDYPMTFFTEASIDLADDAELIGLMVDANIRLVFIGIETPNEASLRETRKLQNLRTGQKSMLEKVHLIQRAGIEVWCGMILGFDNDDASIFDAQRAFIKDARVVNPMIGMLAAIPKTPLYNRLRQDGRLDQADPPAFGTNVIPLRLSQQELREGWMSVVQDLHEPAAYFDRFDALYLDQRIEPERARLRHFRRRPFRLVLLKASWVVEAVGLFLRLMRKVPDRTLRQVYRRRFWNTLRRRPSAVVLQTYAIKCAMHYHAHALIADMRKGSRFVNTI